MTLESVFDQYLLKELNLDTKQYEAVLADRERAKTAYRILITAPAGSGKTRVLASRYLKLLIDGELPENIVAITFTRKAAGEMKSRIVDYLFDFRTHILKRGISSKIAARLCDIDELNKMVLSMRISTIDSFLSNIIRLFPGESGVDPNFTVIEEIEEEELIDITIDAYIEDHLETDKDIISLLRFFDFKYADPGNRGFCLSAVVQGIMKRWEVYSDTVEFLQSAPETAIRSWLLEFLGTPPHIEKHMRTLRDAVLLLQSSIREPGNLLPFITYITDTSIAKLKSNEEEFFSFLDLFYTTSKTLRKRPVVELPTEDAKTHYEEILKLFQQCLTDFLLLRDLGHSELSKPFISLILKLIALIKDKKRELGVLGIGDLKTITHSLLSTHTERFNILFNMDARVNHYLIDEFQDTDPIQWDIFCRLTEDWFSGETAKQERNVTPSLFLVGDEKQSIYGFRNADVRIINQLSVSKDQYTIPLLLEKNYRSKKEIIDTVNSLFTGQMKRDRERPTSVAYKGMTSSDTKGGGKVSIIQTTHEGKKSERTPITARMVANLVCSLHALYQEWGSIALLFRHSLNFQYYEDIFEEMHIPYISSGGKSFFDNSEVKEILKILDFLDNPHDDINLASLFLSPLFAFGMDDLLALRRDRGGKKPDGTRTLFARLACHDDARYRQFADLVATWLHKRDRIAVDQLIEEILLEINGYGILIDRKGGQRDVNIRKLLMLIQNISARASNFAFFYDKLQRVIRAREKNADIDIGTAAFELEEKGAVHLMTVHKAKGLEFPVVILPEIDEATVKARVHGISIDREKPHLLFLKKYAGMDSPLAEAYKARIAVREEEELKRLLYVALTRAQQELYLFMNTSREGEKRIWMNMLCNAPLPIETGLELKKGAGEEIFVSPPRIQSMYQFRTSSKEVRMRKHTSPSEPHHAASRFSVEQEKAKLKGTVLHKLFELISEEKLVPQEGKVETAANAILKQFDTAFVSDAALARSVVQDLTSSLKNRQIHAVVTHPQGVSEFPYSIERKTEEGTIEVVNGIIDRMIFEDTEISIYDYKSDCPADMSETQFISWAKQEYRSQLEEYRFAVRALFSIDSVRSYLILTSINRIVEI